MHFKYDKEKYPKQPIFTSKKDEKGRDYHTAYSNTDGNCVVSMDGTNIVMAGNPKINYRKGDSVFGDEIFFEILVDRSSYKRTPQRTKYDSVEIYMPMDKGIEFLEKTIAFFKSKQKENNNG